MKISEVVNEAKDIPYLERIVILSFALSKRKEEVLTRQNEALSEDKLAYIKALFDERRKGKPLAYITKSKEFFSEEFYIDESVLVPRGETELLVEEALNIIKEIKGDVRIIDIGTGSGIIGILIAKYTQKSVICTDISKDALKVASKNSSILNTKEKTLFICADLLEAIKEEERFHIIVANLPYIKRDEWNNLMRDVREFEPEIALLGGDDGLSIYRKLISSLKKRLKPNGWFLCEIGGKEQAQIMANMLKEMGFIVSVKKDYAQIERIVKAQWINS